jgi:hypothetical protein
MFFGEKEPAFAASAVMHFLCATTTAAFAKRMDGEVNQPTLRINYVLDLTFRTDLAESRKPTEASFSEQPTFSK